jgi:Family of unknown function (DUF5684)
MLYQIGIGLAVVFVFSVIVGWTIFTKAGKPGWATLIPIYNTIVFLEICGKPVWWIILLLIPLVNIIIALILPFALAEKFGHGGGFGLGLLLLPIIFYPILAFGGSQYQFAGGYPTRGKKDWD